MPLPCDEVKAGLKDELDRFEQLIRSVDDEGWRTPTRCVGWTVNDIAAHVVGTLADITAGRFEGLGDPATIERQVAERRGRTQDEVADELAGVGKLASDLLAPITDAHWDAPSPAADLTNGEGIEALWYDAYVHAEDIRAALGRTSERGPGLRAAVSHIADMLGKRGWGPATLALDGFEEFPVSGGGGRRVTGDPLEFVLAGSGRADPAALGLDETVNIHRD